MNENRASALPVSILPSCHRRFGRKKNKISFRIVWVLLILMSSSVAKGLSSMTPDNYYKHCKLSSSTVKLSRNNETGEFTIMRKMENVASPDNQVFNGIQCPCGIKGRDYCIVSSDFSSSYKQEPQYNYCAVASDPNMSVGCYHVNSTVIFVRNAWPVIVLWYGALLLFIIATNTGRNAKHWILNFCNKDRLNRQAQNLLRREVDMRDYILQQQQQQATNNNNNLSSNSPTSLVLKTKRFVATKKTSCTLKDEIFTENTMSQTRKDDAKLHEEDCSDEENKNDSPTTPDAAIHKKKVITTTPETVDDDSSVSDFDEEDVVCTICLGLVKDGDRIGALVCGHTFHVDCLKEWLKRRNACPLCQEQNIATAQFGSSTSVSDEDFLIFNPPTRTMQRGLQRHSQRTSTSDSNYHNAVRTRLFQENRRRIQRDILSSTSPSRTSARHLEPTTTTTTTTTVGTTRIPYHIRLHSRR